MPKESVIPNLVPLGTLTITLESTIVSWIVYILLGSINSSKSFPIKASFKIDSKLRQFDKSNFPLNLLFLNALY